MTTALAALDRHGLEVLVMALPHSADPVRSTPRSRYGPWPAQHLGARHQFDSSGCVGCGRRVVWRPAGIDITEEAAALQNEAER